MLKHGSLIAINITIADESGKNILVNGKVPILYYWNGSTYSDIDSIMNDSAILDKIKSCIVDELSLSTAEISLVSFGLDTDEEYVEKSIRVQDLLNIEDFGSIKDSIIDKVAKAMYKDVFNADYSNHSNCESIIADVYDKVSLMYKENVTLDTFVNFARKKLHQTTKLNEINIQKIVSEIVSILKSKKYPDMN